MNRLVPPRRARSSRSPPPRSCSSPSTSSPTSTLAHDAHRPDAAASLHAVAGHARTLAKIDEPIVLRFYYSPQLGDEIPTYGVYAQRVREMLEEYQARRQRQDRAAGPRSRAVLAGRGPRRRLRAPGRAARPGRRAGLFRPRRHQLDRRSADHPLLPARARALPRIRSDQAHPQPRPSRRSRWSGW